MNQSNPVPQTDDTRPRRGRPPRTDAQRREQRRRLVDGVIEGIRRHGPDLSVEEMALAAGVSKPVLYAEFGDKHGIAEAVADVMGETVERRLRGQVRSSPELETAEVLPELIDSIVELVENDPDLYTFFVHSIRASDRGVIDNPLVRVVHRRMSPFVEALEPTLPAEDREVLTYGAFGFVFASVDSWRVTQQPSRDRFVHVIATALRAGLRAAAP